MRSNDLKKKNFYTSDIFGRGLAFQIFTVKIAYKWVLSYRIFGILGEFS